MTAVFLIAVMSWTCEHAAAQSTAITSVWANNGGDKVLQDEVRASNGVDVTNAVWDGTTIRQFGAQNEVVEVNLILEAKNASASGVSITMSNLTGPGGSIIRYTKRDPSDLFDWTSTEAELFYVRYLQILGASHFEYGIVPATWQEPSFPVGMRCPPGVPAGCAWTQRPYANKFVPDIAVPIELVPTFTIAAGQSQAIWSDIYIPKTATPGLYTGMISISENGVVTHTIPINVTVRNFALPDTPSSKTMLFTGYGDLSLRYTGVQFPNPGTPQDVLTKQVLKNQLYVAHRHKLSLIGDNFGQTWDVLQPAPEWIPFLTGTAFTAANKYAGPGTNTGQDVFSIGTYGGMTNFSGETQQAFTDQFNGWESWFESNSPLTERFVYLCDEVFCTTQTPTLSTQLSWWGGISGVGRNLHTLATQPLGSVVGTTLSDPTSQWVFGNPTTDQANVDAVLSAEPARRLFAYATTRPGEGSMAIEDEGTSLRELPWGQWKKHVDRWFVWESTYYNDTQNNRPMADVFTTAETFGGVTSYDTSYGMIDGGRSDNGDGLSLYPGSDAIFPNESYGISGPIASLRLKYWRRGIQDVDYLTLANAINPSAVAALVQQMVPKVLWEVSCNDTSDCTWTTAPASWSNNSDDWEAARAQLADIIAPAQNGVTAGLTASPSTISNGQSSTLSWSSTDASTCAGSNFTTGGATSGAVSVSPTATTNYGITCSSDAGSVSANATVTVTSGPAPTVSFTAAPASIPLGQSATLTWSSTNAATCTGTNFSTGNATSGSLSVSPSSSTSYSIACTGATGTASSAATVTVNSTVVGLQGSWQFDEGAGTTTTDAVNGNSGALVGTPLPVWTPGLSGSALSFGGSGGFVNVPASTSLNNLASQTGGGMTIVSWVYPKALAGSQLITGKGSWGFGLDGNGTFGFGAFCSSGQVGSYSPANVVLANQWTQLVATWDGSTSASGVLLYVNGQPISAYPQGCSGSVGDDSTSPLTFGATQYNADSMNGTLDSVRLYNRALSASEVHALYVAPPTATVTANPSSINAGQSSTVNWSSNNATSCTSADVSTGNATSGSVSVSPSATTTYSISCTGAGGSTSASTTVTVNSVTAGLRGSWSFDEGAGTTTSDGSGQGNTGVLSGTPTPSWTTGVTGDALLFGGSGGFVNIPASASLNDLGSQGGFSIVLWIFSTNLNGNQTLAGKGGWGFGLDGNGTFGFGGFCTSGQVGSYSPANAVPLNQWTQLVATWDGGTTSASVKLFVNGAEIAAYPQGCNGSIMDDDEYAVTIGATPYNTNPTVGVIDNVRIYSRPLNATEVATLYNSR